MNQKDAIHKLIDVAAGEHARLAPHEAEALHEAVGGQDDSKVSEPEAEGTGKAGKVK